MPYMRADEFIERAGPRPDTLVERSTYRQVLVGLNECGFSRNMSAGLNECGFSPNMRGDSNHEPAIDSSAESLGSPRPCARLFEAERVGLHHALDRKSTRLNSSHVAISYAV